MSSPKSHSRASSACWICDLQALPGKPDEPRILDPRDGRWAHEWCVNKTMAGSAWRLRLAVQDLLEAVWSIRRR